VKSVGSASCSETFPNYSAARAWREDASKAVRERKLRAPTTITVEQAATAWLDGAREGLIRPRSGAPYKPSAIRTYEAALRLRVLPRLGHVRLSEVTEPICRISWTNSSPPAGTPARST
jgi:hypothetical protein